MKRMVHYSIMAFALLMAGPVIAVDDQGKYTERRAMGMSEETMEAMHESMAALSAELDEMRKAESDDIKLRMMEKYMNQMHRQMKMMMDVMEGKSVRRHEHAKMKR